MSTVMTVTGPVDVEDLGVTLPHEHLFINLHNGPRGLITHFDLAVEEVELFKSLGGGAIIDMSTSELTDGASAHMAGWESGRIAATESRAPSNSEMLADLSRATGVHIIAATGHYREPILNRDWFDRHRTDQVAESLIRDIEEGFPGTDVRAGILGEIASSAWYTTAAEERSFRAAARAHLRTGVKISTHAADYAVGFEQLDILGSEGVAPENVIIGHSDTGVDEEYPIAIAERGAYVQFDTFFFGRMGGRLGERALDWRIKLIRRMVDAGHEDRVLLSHDVCAREHLHSNGGTGYALLLEEELRDYMARAGVTADLLEKFMVANVKAALSA